MKLSALRERLAGSYWTIPAGLVLAGVVLSSLLVRVDEAVDLRSGAIGFSGSSTSARSLLSTISSSMLSFTGLVFSITIVVLQLTSSQFSPRVLRTFLRDRQSQWTLGVFVATFLYALMALRQVRGESGLAEQFVPGLTITVAFVLVVVSVAAFIAYIHHITQSIRVVNIIDRIARESESVLERHFKYRDPEVYLPAPPRPPSRVVLAGKKGVVVDVDVGALVEQAERSDTVLVLVPEIGQFVPQGFPLVEVYGSGAGDLDLEPVRRAVAMAKERTMQRDLAFGFRQLVDIAERALSPGVNDPTTAIQCLDQIHELLRRLANRRMPPGKRVDAQGGLRLVVHSPTFCDYLHLALDEIRHWGAGSIQVHRRVRGILEDLLTVTDDPGRRHGLREQMELLDRRLEDLPPVERELARGGSNG